MEGNEPPTARAMKLLAVGVPAINVSGKDFTDILEKFLPKSRDGGC